MNETTFFTTLLQEHYALKAISLHPLSGSSFDEGYLAYQIQDAKGTFWIARAYQHDRFLSDWFRYFYPWATSDIGAWLLTRAGTLVYLEQQGYPAPRVLRTRSGMLLCETELWHILLTTFVEGTVLQPTLEQLRFLGAALGNLHALSPESMVNPPSPIGKSYWDTEHVFSTVMAHLVSIEHRLPKEWKALHTDFCQTIQRFQQRPDLPRIVIHGDVWPANAVQTPSEEIILVDWDSGGWGPALLDLGRLLLECHLDSNLPYEVPLAWHIQPNAHRIAAVVEGYAQKHMPTSEELDFLLDSIRFGVIFIGALHFTQALTLEEAAQTPSWKVGMDRRFARLENRWAVSQEIASFARRRFEQLCDNSCE